jgi:hypothetical protein
MEGNSFTSKATILELRGRSQTASTSLILGRPFPHIGRVEGTTKVLQELDFSPWILNPGLSDGKITIIYGERLTVTNGSLNRTVAFLKQMTFTPATVIANSQAFPAPQTIYEDDTSSGATFGYPSFVTLLPGNTLIQFNDQPADQTAIGQLWTMTGQYAVAGAINPPVGDHKFSRGASVY